MLACNASGIRYLLHHIMGCKHLLNLCNLSLSISGVEHRTVVFWKTGMILNEDSDTCHVWKMMYLNYEHFNDTSYLKLWPQVIACVSFFQVVIINNSEIYFASYHDLIIMLPMSFWHLNHVPSLHTNTPHIIM